VTFSRAVHCSTRSRSSSATRWVMLMPPLSADTEQHVVCSRDALRDRRWFDPIAKHVVFGTILHAEPHAEPRAEVPPPWDLRTCVVSWSSNSRLGGVWGGMLELCEARFGTQSGTETKGRSPKRGR
jgi:hypothetical protein